MAAKEHYSDLGCLQQEEWRKILVLALTNVDQSMLVTWNPQPVKKRIKEIFLEYLGGPSAGSAGKEPACSAGDAGDSGSILGSGRFPGEGNGKLLQILTEKPHVQKSLVGYSPQGHQESDTTEHKIDLIEYNPKGS